MIINDAGGLALPGGGLECLDRFRAGAYACLTRRSDALFDLADAVTCGGGRVTDLAHLSLDPCHRRGHGGLYDGINAGRLDVPRLRRLIASGPVPRIAGPDGRSRVVLAVDVSNWLRPDAVTSPDRSFCHTYARGRGQAQMIPGWPYSFVVALESGASSWTTPLDVVRIRPEDDATAVTAHQLRTVIDELSYAGHWRQGDPDVLVVMDAGYDVVRLVWLLSDLPVILIARVRSDRVFYRPAGKRRGPTKGRPPRHGAKMVLRRPGTHPEPAVITDNDTNRYGHVQARAFPQLHPKIESRGGWKSHDGTLPIIEGAVIGLQVQRLPGNRDPKPLWLWASKPLPENAAEVDHWWSLFLRRFDIEHTFRFLKQTLGWTTPRLRNPDAADRWTWIIIAAYTQLRLARPLARDHRLPWQAPLTPAKLTPARVRAGYRQACATAVHPANPPKHTRPGPGRPKGRRNRRKAPSQPVGKRLQG